MSSNKSTCLITVPLASVPGRCQLRSADANKLSTPRMLTSTLGLRSSSVAGPGSWNAVPPRLPRDPDLTLELFRQLLKTALFFVNCDKRHCDSSC